MYLLDSINWGLIIGPLAYFMLVGGLMDGYFIFLFLRIRRLGIAIGEALLANLFSLIVSFIAWPFIFPRGFDYAELSMGSYGLLWLLTVISEALVIRIFNRKKSWKPVLLASLCMNLVSFTILYLFFYFIN